MDFGRGSAGWFKVSEWWSDGGWSWNIWVLAGLRASLCGLSAWAPLGFLTAWRLRAPAGVFYNMAASEVLQHHFHHIPLVISESQAYPGSWGKELDFSS